MTLNSVSTSPDNMDGNFIFWILPCGLIELQCLDRRQSLLGHLRPPLCEPSLSSPVMLDVAEILSFCTAQIELPDIRVFLQCLGAVVHHDAAALASSWFRNPNRFPCSEAVQDIRAEVDSIGPDDRPRFGVHPDLFEKFHILQRTEDPAAAGNPSSQVDLARSPVGETQLQAVLSGVPDPLYAWKHNNLLIQRPDQIRRLLIVQAVPVPKQFALM